MAELSELKNKINNIINKAEETLGAEEGVQRRTLYQAVDELIEGYGKGSEVGVFVDINEEQTEKIETIYDNSVAYQFKPKTGYQIINVKMFFNGEDVTANKVQEDGGVGGSGIFDISLSNEEISTINIVIVVSSSRTSYEVTYDLAYGVSYKPLEFKTVDQTKTIIPYNPSYYAQIEYPEHFNLNYLKATMGTNEFLNTNKINETKIKKENVNGNINIQVAGYVNELDVVGKKYRYYIGGITTQPAYNINATDTFISMPIQVHPDQIYYFKNFNRTETTDLLKQSIALYEIDPTADNRFTLLETIQNCVAVKSWKCQDFLTISDDDIFYYFSNISKDEKNVYSFEVNPVAGGYYMVIQNIEAISINNPIFD